MACIISRNPVFHFTVGPRILVAKLEEHKLISVQGVQSVRSAECKRISADLVFIKHLSTLK